MITIKEHIALASMTTFGIGGEAHYFVEVQTEDELREALHWARERAVRPVLLAGGSNTLIADQGVDALVIHMIAQEHSFAGTELAADAGCNLLALIREASAKGLGGWEKLAGIPGTIGGAVRGNAGAFGSEIKDFATKVRALDSETGDMRAFTNVLCDFSYRRSFFKDHPEWIITRAYVELRRVESTESARLIGETIAEREKRHLQNVHAAGSYFMNPVVSQEIIDLFEREKGVKSREGRVPAGWLIEKAGMKGVRVGGATCSSQHPNYIVNQDAATAEDVRALAEKVKTAVRTQFGVELHEEAALL